jgi:CheY-like chemotaxis protein
MAGSILLVDDDRDLRDVLTEALQLEGHSVTSAANGEVALTYLRSGARPCLILLDLMMPVMDGATFRETLLKDESLRDIPVVVITAGGPQIAANVNADMVLQKPLHIDAVLDVVQTYCKPAQS